MNWDEAKRTTWEKTNSPQINAIITKIEEIDERIKKLEQKSNGK